MEDRRGGEDGTDVHGCCDCDAEFCSTADLLNHYDSSHIPTYGNELNHPLLCPYCLRNFTEDNNFASHVELHEFEGPLFSCEFCTKCFKSKKLLRFHQGESLHKCPFCHTFVSRSHLSDHLKRHRLSQLYECTTCFSRITYEEIVRHMKLHNSEAGIVSTCDECAKIFPSRKTYSLHMKRGHDTYPCDICLAVIFTSRKEWENHRQVHFTGSFPCFVCQKVFTEPTGLKNHQDICSHHSNVLSDGHIQAASVVRKNCPMCSIIIPSRQEMKAHIRNEHIDLLAYQCQDCSEICFGKQEYLVHKYSHSHQFQCQVCKTEFATDIELSTHLIIHKKVKTVFICEFCEIAFETKESLLGHKIIHSQPKHQFQQTALRISGFCSENDFSQQNPHYHPVQSILSRQKMFSCLLCQQKFSNKAKLDTHIYLNHKKVTPTLTTPALITTSPISKPVVNILYRCKACNLLFPGDDKFQEHQLKFHKVNNHFTCEQCNSTFQIISELRQHQMKTCTSTTLVYKPYRCLKCNKKFMLEGSLNIHLCNLGKQESKKSFKYMPEEDTDVSFVLTIG